MEEEMETTAIGYVGGISRAYIEIMEKKVEATI